VLAPSFTDPDTDLVEASRNGDLAAFGRLVDRHRDMVFRVAARIVGTGDAEDVTQDTFLRAFHRLGRFRAEGTFRSWLLQIAHNRALTLLESQKRTTASDEVEELAEQRPGPRTPAERLEESERRGRLVIKLGNLSPAHRTVLVLRDVEGLSYEEIAQVTGAPLGSVKGRLHRARDEMVQLLRANTYDWDLPR
jgi:RNA polymerase sigma-70 factor (ECF subfamily)